MNDFERKLAAQPFRTPPAELRRTVLAACEPAPRAAWREWLWPSPTAWGALAAVWLLCLAADVADAPSGGTLHPQALHRIDQQTLRASPLFAGQSPEALRHVLELTR
jgi:hypothetical protein